MIKLHSLVGRIGREGHLRARHGCGVFRGSVRNGQGILFRLVLRRQGHIVRRHIESNTSVSLFFRSQFQILRFPAGEDPASAVLRVCIDTLPIFLLFRFSVHGQSIVVDCVVCRQGHIASRHPEEQVLVIWVIDLCTFHGPAGKGVAFLFRRSHLDQ